MEKVAVPAGRGPRSLCSAATVLALGLCCVCTGLHAQELVRLEPLTAGKTIDVGPVFGISSVGGSPVGVVGLQPQRTALDVGVRWTRKFHEHWQVDVTAWRRMGSEDAYTLAQAQEPVYGARVEMKLKPASPLSLEGGLVGMQLESGARISIRRKNGGPMIYYRTSF